MIYVAAYLSVFMVVGHLAFGIKWYLKPILGSDADKIPRTVMHAVFHYVTVLMLMSAVALVADAHGLIAVSSMWCCSLVLHTCSVASRRSFSS